MNDTARLAHTLAPQHPLTDRVRDSLACCHDITRRHARNFYYGLKLTPEPQRSALYAIYAFMRACDDLADDEQPGPAASSQVEQRLAQIQNFRDTMQQIIQAQPGEPLPPGKVWPAFQYVTARYRIDPALLHDMLDGQRDDLLQKQYETFDDLYNYCYKVASVVGLVCLAIWGHDGQADNAKLAEHRGIAFQLTNILRDLVEDAQRGRVYLPAQEMRRYNITAQALAQRQAEPGFDDMMNFQIQRAQDYYQRSASLEQRINPQCAPTCWAMTRIYQGLLNAIARRPRNVLKKRVRLSAVHKLAIAAQARLRRAAIHPKAPR